MSVEIINGKNTGSGLSAPLKVLNEFYAGFNDRDVARCMENWANTDDVIMCNPIGGMRKGWNTIAQGYQRIMQGNTRVYVELYDYQLSKCEDMFFVVGRERGYAQHNIEDSTGDKEQCLELAIRTSRVFQKLNGIWRQVHHHGSIDEPSLLNQYQTFINRR